MNQMNEDKKNFRPHTGVSLKSHLVKVFISDSWVFVRHLIVLAGITILIFGIIMTMKGLTGKGIINIKTAIFEGKLETGTIGLLFSFLGCIILLFCLWSRTKSKINLKRNSDGSIVLEHTGSFGKKKAENIARVIGIEIKKRHD